MKTRAVYPGTFDPVTNGHIDLIQRSGELFDQVIVAVLKNTEKSPLFTVAERVEMLGDAIEGLKNVSVTTFEGLLVDFAQQSQATVIVRGIRAVSDYEYELQMALMNRRLAPRVETVFLMPAETALGHAIEVVSGGNLFLSEFPSGQGDIATGRLGPRSGSICSRRSA